MSLFSDNVIPGNHGKVFGTNATSESDMMVIKEAILKIDGIKDVLLDLETFPHELTVYTSDIVSVKDVEDAVLDAGFHAIPKQVFGL